MPNIMKGSTQIKDIKIGNITINKVFVGSNPVWYRSYSATMTVGKGSYTPFLHSPVDVFGYTSAYGSLTRDDADSYSKPNAYISQLDWKTYDSDGRLYLRLYNNGGGMNSGASNGNEGWTTLTIGSKSYSRSSGWYYHGSNYRQWLWMAPAMSSSSSNNPFGTTVGATRSISIS
jgi:hypothetical protein